MTRLVATAYAVVQAVCCSFVGIALNANGMSKEWAIATAFALVVATTGTGGDR